MRRGVYEIFTVLIFIFVMLGALFFWLAISGTISAVQMEVSENRLSIVAAREAYADITRCMGGSVFDKDRLDECLGVQRDFVKAVKLEQEAINNCDLFVWGGERYDSVVEDTSVQSYPYWVVLQQEGEVCLARMVIAI